MENFLWFDLAVGIVGCIHPAILPVASSLRAEITLLLALSTCI